MESRKQAGHDGLGGRSNGSIANNDFVQFFPRCSEMTAGIKSHLAASNEVRTLLRC